MTEVRTEMVGNVWKILVNVGDSVGSDESIVILESMKMEMPISAGISGRVVEIRVTEGETVLEGDVLALVE